MDNETKILRDTLREIRQAVMDDLPDTFWISPIETVVDRIDEVLGGSHDVMETENAKTRATPGSRSRLPAKRGGR